MLDFEKSNFGYNTLQQILNDMQKGISVITASASIFYLKNGEKAIDTGSFVKILEEINLTKIENFGKPSLKYFSIAGDILNEASENIYVIGDDWNTDIQGANEYGAKSILVRSGKYQKNDEKKCKPFKIVNTLTEI